MESFNPEEALRMAKREFGEHGGVAPSLSRSSTFTVLEPRTMPEIFEGLKGPEKGGCYLYSRHFNPTVNVLARYLAAMEDTEFSLCTASGMAAISCALLQICKAGDHIVASDTVYGGTHALLESLLPQMGIRTTFVDIVDSAAVAAAMEKQTRLIYTEGIGNPTLKVADLPSLSTLAHDAGAWLVVDNTFSPLVLTPARLGADVVIHSLTKFINGASDLLGGVICADRDFIYRLMDLHTGRAMLLGPSMDPRAAFDVIQRIPHLPLRMQEHGRRAAAIAAALDDLGTPVIYPGLPSHPQQALLGSMANEGYGAGGILAIDCGTRQAAEQLLSILQNREAFGLIAVSLGYFDTLMSHSGSSTASEIAPEDQQRMGLSQGLVRMSIGYTGSLEQRIEQITRAVKEIGLSR
ncbi:MAG: aminotransferase class I/II-fold pyridoxal phosphate-dependent enzyme [Desulfobacterales bacterium]|jgi:methionine-gamma-lyase